jgi:hypothetical protein
MTSHGDLVAKGKFKVRDARPVGWNLWACHDDGSRTLVGVYPSKAMARSKAELLTNFMAEVIDDDVTGPIG